MIISGSSHLITAPRYSMAVRINGGTAASSTYLSRTGLAGNSSTWTFSTWIKRSVLANAVPLFIAGTGAVGTYTYLIWRGNGQFNVGTIGGTPAAFDHSSAVAFTDFTHWYHLLVAVDTTQTTGTSRSRLYVDSVEITSFNGTDTQPTQNQASYVNTVNPHYLARYTDLTNATAYDPCELAETYLVDGTQLTPASFGKTVGSLWRPIPYTGALGTNGFYLNYQNRSNFGQAIRGNSYTANNMVGSDQTVDYPN